MLKVNHPVRDVAGAKVPGLSIGAADHRHGAFAWPSADRRILFQGSHFKVGVIKTPSKQRRLEIVLLILGELGQLPVLAMAFPHESTLNPRQRLDGYAR